jgi:hypothetical protein
VTDRPARSPVHTASVALASPFVVSAAVLLSRYTTVPTTPESTLRSFVVLMVVAAAVLLCASWALRSAALGAIAATAFMLFTLRELLPVLPLLAFLLWWPLLNILRRAAKRPPPARSMPLFIARATGIFGLVFLAMSTYSATAATIDRPPEIAEIAVDPLIAGPNIYVLLMDGYPRADTLDETFGIDNQPFLDDLEDLGFSISPDARSNYNKTWLTMASMLNGAYIDDMLGDATIPRDNASQIRWLHHWIDRAAILDVFREAGYRIRTIPSGFMSTGITTSDDFSPGPELNDFEARLLALSPWSSLNIDAIAEFLLSNHENGVLRALELTAAWADNPRAPQFVITHVHSPHLPFVFSEERGMPGCFPVACSLWHVTVEELEISLDEYRQALESQLDALNDRVLEAVGSITAADPEGIVVLMSDHGARYSLNDTAEHYRSFLASRTPDRSDPLFASDESSVNILRVLASAYLDVSLPRLPHETWSVNWYRVLEMELDEQGG